jgi:hypothetical protein
LYQAGIGGPLIDFKKGGFIGMNFYDGKTRGTPFLPRSKIIEVLSGLELMSGRYLCFLRHLNVNLLATSYSTNLQWEHFCMNDI